ncbi:hypothetical protein [Methyloversatilis sp.]|uniref:hypothetical protein n=1 Tax=Methyloversatilis sp. TaxID=2569862 RepID=UPI0035AFFCFC
MDAFIKATLRPGPSGRPESGFVGIQTASRNRSGIAARSPHILRRQADTPAAGTLYALQTHLPGG